MKSLILVCLLSWIGGTELQAQSTTIYGVSTATVNDVTYYSVNINDNLFHYFWSVYGGTKSSIQEQSVTVTWTSSGVNSVGYEAESEYDLYYGQKNVSVTPSAPPMPTITNNCGNTVLTRTTSVPTGETYYWQSSSTGTDTSSPNGDVSITLDSGTVHYLRSKSGSLWSAARTVSYTINQPTTYYADFDGDGFGDPDDTILDCNQPANYITSAGDNCPLEPGTVNGCHHLTANLSNENYIYTVQPRVAMQDLSSTDSDDYIESITYYDGLGRPKQSIAKQAGGNKQDVITPYVYDAYGRQVQEYLPYADPNQTTSSLSYRTHTTLMSDLETYYDTKFPNEWGPTDVINPYSEKSIEASPLGRVLEQGAPGKSWLVDKNIDTDQTVKFEYGVNVADEVSKFKIIYPTGNFEEPQLFYDGSYGAGDLYKSILKDELWSPNQTNIEERTIEEFKDKEGRVILKRQHGESNLVLVPHDTYYVYDDFGNLTYVLSPKGSDLILYQNTYNPSTLVVDEEEVIPLDGNNNPITTGSGDITVTVNDVTKELTVNFNVSFNTAIDLLNGPTAKLQNDIPNMMVGNITAGGVDYIVSIQEGYLHLSGSGLVSSVTDTFVVDLMEHSVDDSVIDDLGYQYIYDHKNRLVEKKISGKEWEYIVYDKLDRPVLTQDGNLRSTDHWLFTKYDNLERVAYTGKMLIQNEDRQSIQTLIDTQTTINESSTTTANYIQGWSIFYTNNALDLSSVSANITELYTINYYDTYNSDLTTAVPNPSTVFGTNVTSNTTSLATGSLVYVLDKSQWITTVNYYDDKARLIYIGTKNNYLGTTDIIKNDLNDFTGALVKAETSHTKGANPAIVITDDFTYDHTDRLTSQVQTISGQSAELIAENTYDEVGQLVSKDVGNTTTTPLQTVDYKYNVRGWLTEMNDYTSLGNDLWGFKIGYNYNGLVSSTNWKTKSVNNEPLFPVSEGYGYTYNSMNRITHGYDDTGYYNLHKIKYDKNGNILVLLREGARKRKIDVVLEHIDQISYTYKANSNQLLKVSDGVTTYGNHNSHGFIDGTNTGDDYAYDDNGNMTQDLNKDITAISYNHLNLPKLVTASTGNIEYIYDALGIKLEKVVTEGSSVTKTKYANNFVYYEDSTGEHLQFFNHPEGYVDASGSGYLYVYQFKDHLGNVRLSYADSDNDNVIDTGAGYSEILEENNYYPFGIKHGGYNSVVGSTNLGQDYKFNGKEYNQSLGLNLYEMDVRQYDPTIGRWTSIDPVTHHSMSTYNGFDNNPATLADPSGADADSEWMKGYSNSNGATPAGFSNAGDGPGGFDKALPIAKAKAKKHKSASIEVGELEMGEFEGDNNPCPDCDYRFRIAMAQIKLDIAKLQGASEKEISKLTTRLKARKEMYADFRVSEIVAPTDPLSLSLLPLTVLSGGQANNVKNLFSYILKGGKTFRQYKKVRGGTKTLRFIETSTGRQRISTEFHHVFITQRLQNAYGLPNWLVNNRLNVWKLNTVQHSLLDSYRYKFLRNGFKSKIGWFNAEYNFFTKF